MAMAMTPKSHFGFAIFIFISGFYYLATDEPLEFLEW